MIDEDRTLELFGYTSDELKPKSQKKVVRVCERCGKHQVVIYHQCSILCRQCSVTQRNKEPISEHRRQALSDSRQGDKHPMFGVHRYGINNPNWKGGRKISICRAHAKRKQFGHTPLNDPFQGSEGHHITKDLVIFIPKEMHKQIYHRLDTYRGMNEINTLALGYLIITEKSIKTTGKAFHNDRVYMDRSADNYGTW